MSVGALGSALDTQTNLASQLLGGEMKMADQAMQVAKVNMQMQLKAQEMEQTQAAVATMTGVGTNVDAVA